MYQLSIVESQIYMEKNDFQQALKIIHEGRATSQVDNRLLSGRNYLIEAAIHKELGDSDNELDYYRSTDRSHSKI